MGGVASHSLGRRGQERLASQGVRGGGVRWPWNELLLEGLSLPYRRKIEKFISLYLQPLSVAVRLASCYGSWLEFCCVLVWSCFCVGGPQTNVAVVFYKGFSYHNVV